MKIAVTNETSAGDKNHDIISALGKTGHDIINAGMIKSGGDPELSYIETGFLGAILLTTGRADFIVGGCGTGQGFMNSIMQYPGVFCGLVRNPLDAWLFSRINAGNCVSLALNEGYGWAGDINLTFIFEKMFASEPGIGFPEHRSEAQKMSRQRLISVSQNTHLPFDLIISRMDPEIVQKVLRFPGVWDLLDVGGIGDEKLAAALLKAK